MLVIVAANVLDELFIWKVVDATHISFDAAINEP